MDKKKKLPKAPPMSPVRQMAKMSEEEFRELQKKVNLFSGRMKYHMDRTKDKDGLDFFDRMKETAVQLKPMVAAEAKKRRDKNKKQSKKNKGKQDFRKGGMVLSVADNRKNK